MSKMFKKRHGAVIIASIMAMAFAVMIYAAPPDGAVSIASPDGRIVAKFWLDASGAPFYNVVAEGETLIEDSKMGITTSSGNLSTGLSLLSV
jgi:hypothetical protein